MKPNTTLYYLFAILYFTTACTNEPNLLAGTSWVLQEFDAIAQPALIPGTTLTIEFTADGISGNTGCNHYGGAYQSNENSLQVGEIASAVMGCHSLILEQEGRFMDTLLAADSFLLDNGRLTIISANGQLVFTPFAPILEQTPPSSPLSDNEWALVALETVNGPLLPVRGTAVTLQFKDAQILGHSGCNPYTANIHLVPTAYLLLVSSISRGNQQCDAAIGLIENEYFGMLETTVSFTLQNQTLLIDTAKGTLSFKQTP